MEQEFADLQEQVAELWTLAMTQAELLLLPSRLWQLGILALCILAAWLLHRWLSPQVREWMHGLEGRPKWQLRTLLLLNKRLGLMIFTALIWISAWIVAEITPFMSRRFLLELVGTISLAVLLVGLAARLVRDVPGRRGLRLRLVALRGADPRGCADPRRSP